MGGNTPSSGSSGSSTTNTTTPPASGGGGTGAAGGLFGSNMVQDYMQQIMQNPRQLEGMLNAPHMQTMLQMMANNPEVTRMIVENSPQLSGTNPEMREQMARSMPAMLQQVKIILLLFFKLF